jgi:F-type H+-transporting ATPase subunit gamma
MIQSLRQIKRRIRSIENTKKLTRAMEMISVSKLKRSGRMRENSKLFFSKIESILFNLLSGGENTGHPFLEERPDKQKIGFCILTSDTGLCGNYNHSVIRTAENFLSKYHPENVKLVALGRKGFIHFRKKGFSITHSYVGFNGRYSKELSEKLLKCLTMMFLSAEVSEIYIAYTRPETAARRKAVVEKILNIDFVKAKEIEYIYEPNRARILEELIPVYLSNKITMTILSAFTSEHQARAISMGEATNNATELLEGLILSRNKIRQSNITREIIEIISSAEALKG